jgi:DNA-binding PadR family transcriptional regulator
MRGARPSFTEFHKWMALELIAEKKRISRKELSRWLSLGEGSVRTLLEELKSEGMVTSCRSGHSLTVKGWKYLGEPLLYVQVDVKGITVGRVNVATLVRGAAEKVNPIRQRDEAIKVGASGATVLVFKKGKLRFPEDFMEVPSEVQEKLVQLFQPREM